MACHCGTPFLTIKSYEILRFCTNCIKIVIFTKNNKNARKHDKKANCKGARWKKLQDMQKYVYKTFGK